MSTMLTINVVHSFQIDSVTEARVKRLLTEFFTNQQQQLDRMERKIDKMSDETKALLKKIDDATTAIGARIQKLIDGSTDTELNEALQSEVDKLTALGADPSNPVPAT